ncbi:hypothetical protein [Rhizobium bangladeshense]|uniref:hypothetical protein n=1 Tax=Rhizobium bangladeshense TaxID=1138189 RepID=UPI001A99E970|nr:hypothetical protein [Rhizobium bangladeshense]MBX4893619.1 hypothetical protein [Rhizobium bangladeshense]MBX4935289.1 hypothetical protein [Rhizobium bangladeshense]QSY91974.1 hypothetical protein J2J98_26605 [Rhizobium bangladeshense]
MDATKQSIMRYLLRQGWKQQTSRDGALTRFGGAEGDGSPPVNIFFSTESGGADADKAELAAALETIRQVYGLSESALRAMLASLSYDKILATVPDDYLRHESIELRAARSYLNGMKGIIAASATTVITGERSFRRTVKEAKEFADGCRFAHTFKGSFGLAIESPVGLNNQTLMPFVEPELPLGRKTLRRIAVGLESLKAAYAQDDLGPILSAPDGLNANMCNELVGIIEGTGIPRIELSFILSPEWEPEAPLPAPFKIERRYRDILKDASARLAKDDTEADVSIFGRIVNLHAAGNPSDLMDDDADRIIQVNWDSPDLGMVKVSVSLDPARYLVAVEAHRQGRPITIQGKLRRKGRQWSLQDPGDLAVVTI